MKHWQNFCRTFSLLIGFALYPVSPVSAQKSYKDIVFPPLHEFHIPNVHRLELPNGMVLFLLEDHDLPIVNMEARIGVGSFNEPEDKVGLASMMGEVMRTGGTKIWPGDKLDEYLESIGASIEISVGDTSGSAFASFLAENTKDVLPIFADLLMHPSFPQDKIDLQKVEMRSAIARRNDDPNGIAFREFYKLIYGSSSPYARHPEYKTVDAITRDDLVEFYKNYFHPDNIMLGIWGDFNSEKIIKAIKKVFGAWPKSNVARPKPFPVNYVYDSSLNFIRKTDVNQSTILIGHIGGLMNNPDYFALQVMNYILGESFSSRLFRRVRDQQGLAYAVFGQYGANYDYPGVFYIGCMTKSQSTVQATRALLKELQGMLTEEVTDEELKLAKDSFLNSFVFNFDTRGEIIRRIMTYEYYGYPKDFLERARAAIEKVTREDVMRVARQYLKPDKVRILVLGNDKDFDESLSVLGDIKEIDITIPPAEKPKAPEITAESADQAINLLNYVAQNLGGIEAVQGIRTVQTQASGSMETPGGTMQFQLKTWVDYANNRRRVDLQLPMRTMIIIVTEEQGWIVTAEAGILPIPSSMLEELRKEVWTDPIYFIQHYRDNDVSLQFIEEESGSEEKVEGVLIRTGSGDEIKWYFNSKHHLPTKVVSSGRGIQGAPVIQEELRSDFRDVNGVLFAFELRILQDGKPYQTIHIKDLRVNEDLDPSLFKVEATKP